MWCPNQASLSAPIPGIDEGATFEDRTELHEAGVHRQTQAGITGIEMRGAESIVVSGGYADDFDLGSEILYTGHGGQDTRKRQVADQTFDAPGNAAMVTSMVNDAVVRVIRGANRKSVHAPASGLRYDGIFRVQQAKFAQGKLGFRICQFHMVKVDPLGDVDTNFGSANVQVSSEIYPPNDPVGVEKPGRRATTVQRIVRSSTVVERVKRIHDNQCQMCNTRLNIGERGYSEGAHIRPLGGIHQGPICRRTSPVCVRTAMCSSTVAHW